MRRIKRVEARPQTIVFYECINGHAYADEWIDGLGLDGAIVVSRLERVECGNFGDCKSDGDGVYELRIDHGPGYRVYFGQHNDIVVLLCGGDKGTQDADIKLAKKLWTEYKRGESNG